jgi:hypothetical protein
MQQKTGAQWGLVLVDDLSSFHVPERQEVLVDIEGPHDGDGAGQHLV